MRQLELRHIHAFVCVARQLHFSRAVDQHGIAAPTLTKLIQDAERLLDVRLFHRTTRSVALSAARGRRAQLGNPPPSAFCLRHG
ncbi:regulatory helix-turn-helix LysR family protein [Paraburkholderia sp. RAU2J]|nr:regulatory helix-turn-helix LysR family protein [Paraburkholderia sp. RAU2J]